MLIIPASITIETETRKHEYKWISSNKRSIYTIKGKRAFVRITSLNFTKKLNEKSIADKQVRIKFYKTEGIWKLILERSKEENATLQTYCGLHPYIQLVLNKHLPQEIWEEYKSSGKKTYTRQINVELNIDEWQDINLEHADFLPEVEKKAKELMKEALNYNFNIDFVPKGKAYDLELVGPNKKRFILAISSHNAKNESRSKEKRKQKILMDIAKILPVLYTKKVCPVIVSEPLSFNGSWSYTTDAYLDFYKEKFNFKFLTTNFKSGWEKDICIKLLELEK